MGKVFEEAASFKNDWKEIDNSIPLPEMTVSVVIPVYLPTNLDEVIDHLAKIGGIKEIILIDDFYQGKPGIEKFDVEGIIIKYFRNKLDSGSPHVRNVGVAQAEGDILVFMDQDMFLDPEFIISARKYLAANNNHAVVLGLRDTVPYDKIAKYDNWVRANGDNDWRMNTKVEDYLIDITAGGVGDINYRCEVGKNLRIYDTTNKLRDFGVTRENIVGVWDLPSMVIGHSIAVTYEDYCTIGRFPEFVVGWGGDDMAFGFLAVAHHIPIILTNCVSYHIQHKPHSGSLDENKKELILNMKKYQEWATGIDEFPTCEIETWKEWTERIYPES